MFNYYKMKLKGNGGGSHSTFFLNMWLGGGGTFYVFIYMLTTGTGFKGSSYGGAIIVASVFYLYGLFFFSQHFKGPRIALLISSALFSIFSVMGLIHLISFNNPWATFLGIASVVFYSIAFNLTRISIKYRYFQRR